MEKEADAIEKAVKADPDYIKRLESLDERDRLALLDGVWDLNEGRFFDSFDRDVHVIKPFLVPPEWHRYVAIDYGLDALACVWAAVDPKGNVYIYRELQLSDTPIYEAAAEIKRRTPANERIHITLAPPDLWGRSQESGKKKADVFREAGLTLTVSSNDREAGWLGIKDYLRLRGEPARPKLYIFSDCVQLIRNLPLLMRDEKKPTDCMTEPHDITHLPDALRYLIVYWVRANAVPEAKPQTRWPKDMLDDYYNGTPEERAAMEAIYGKPYN
jgi:hypothetical protein